MSAGTKVVLAVLAVLVAVSVLYYLVIGDDTPEPLVLQNDGSRAVTDSAPKKSATKRPVAPKQAKTAAGRPPAKKPARPRRQSTAGPAEPAGKAGDLLSRSVALATGKPEAAQTTSGKTPARRPVASSKDPVKPKPKPKPSRTGPPVASSLTHLPITMGQPSPEPKRSTIAPGPAPVYADYFVKPGDTMSSIAVAWYGAADRWSDIARANPMVDPNTIRPGQRLRLPPRDRTGKAPGDKLPSPPSDNVHIVASGETLSAIAKRVYGTSTRWREIYTANRALIGSNPNALEVGMRLRIP